MLWLRRSEGASVGCAWWARSRYAANGGLDLQEDATGFADGVVDAAFFHGGAVAVGVEDGGAVDGVVGAVVADGGEPIGVFGVGGADLCALPGLALVFADEVENFVGGVAPQAVLVGVDERGLGGGDGEVDAAVDIRRDRTMRGNAIRGQGLACIDGVPAPGCCVPAADEQFAIVGSGVDRAAVDRAVGRDHRA